MKFHCIAFLNAALLVGGAETAHADYWIDVATPNGSDVPAIQVEYDMSPAERAYTDQYMADAYPRATVLRPSTRLYNCHSFAWHSFSATNGVWLNDPSDNIYWEDGSYAYVQAAQAGWASRVSYWWDDHSAVMLSANDFVSKWGSGPLMRHAANYTPYDGRMLVHFMPVTP